MTHWFRCIPLTTEATNCVLHWTEPYFYVFHVWFYLSVYDHTLFKDTYMTEVD